MSQTVFVWIARICVKMEWSKFQHDMGWFHSMDCDPLFPAADSEVSCDFGSMKYYALCGFGGILSCGLTHTAIVPLDLVKYRLQVCM